MNDLSSLDWNGSKPGTTGQQPSGPRGNYYPALRPTPPTSGTSTPSPALYPSQTQKSTVNGPTGSRGSTPVNDSFANLVSFNVAQSAKILSLQEQQQKLQEEKALQQGGQRASKAFDSRFGGIPSSTVSGTSSRNNGTPIQALPSATIMSRDTKDQILPRAFGSQVASPMSESEGDILAAFNAATPVDKSSHMPLPSITNGFGSQSATHSEGTSPNPTSFDDDDDPFGLGTGPSSGVSPNDGTKVRGGSSLQDEDDVLGMLSRPISEFPKPSPTEKAPSESKKSRPDNPRIQALNELVDMGFEPAKCKLALESTESGFDVQGAVGWLIHQAHEESGSKKKTNSNDRGRETGKESRQARSAPKRRTSSSTGSTKPTWMKEQASSQQRHDSKSSATGEKDPAQYATEIGSSLFKTANSLWKSGQKKLNQAVSELNSADNVDPSQPKWMREASQQQQPSTSKVKARQGSPNKSSNDNARASSKRDEKPAQSNVTDEALLLEAGGGPPPRQKAMSRPKAEPSRTSQNSIRDERSPQGSDRDLSAPPQPKFLQQSSREPLTKLSRQAVEEEAATAYISPARRKKTFPKPQNTETGPDLLLTDGDTKIVTSKPISKRGMPVPQPAPQDSRRVLPKTLPTRPPPPQRTIPPISSIALQSSTNSRNAGSEAFKRGDYGSATAEYTKALNVIPPSHPLAIVILTNRALSHSKTGDSKASIADATTVLDLIGPSRGVGETIDLGKGDDAKAMDTYWGKAMLRKAEGLEHLERWKDAAAVWHSCVESGVGGATSIAGRNRSENAARPKPPPAVKKVAPRPKPSALSDLGPSSTHSTEAVSRLRAANAAADKLDDEKFRLADIVDGRVSRWRAGKEANLRALLASLENVLWDDAGWKKTGMGELIQPNKVKIVYMRGIGKVHPDKLPTTATTEHQMISAAVFATLNEAWERFKTENNL